MKLPEDQTTDILTRLRRVEGQIRGIHGMIEDGRECKEVITQYAAAISALEQAGFRFFTATMAECNVDPDRAKSEGYSDKALEKMFLQLA